MKNIVVTGAGGHLGKVVVDTFLQKEYNVIAIVSSDASKSGLPARDCLYVYVADLTDESATDETIKKIIDQHTTIDAALLLAGGFAGGNVASTSAIDIQRQIDLNFFTAYNVARPLFRHMLEKEIGRIVFIGARPALEASAGKNVIAYGLSKSMLFKLSEYLNAEAKGKNVVTAVVALSTLNTGANRKSMPDADASKWVEPAALAEILAFIVNDSGSPIRETVLKVYNNA